MIWHTKILHHKRQFFVCKYSQISRNNRKAKVGWKEEACVQWTVLKQRIELNRDNVTETGNTGSETRLSMVWYICVVDVPQENVYPRSTCVIITSTVTLMRQMKQSVVSWIFICLFFPKKFRYSIILPDVYTIKCIVQTNISLKQ